MRDFAGGFWWRGRFGGWGGNGGGCGPGRDLWVVGFALVLRRNVF
jgi:hypothetical protein